MVRNSTREGVSSRFRLQHMSANTREAMVVDTGCQRCQHCMLRRLLPPVSPTASTSTVDQDVSGREREKTRSHPCK